MLHSALRSPPHKDLIGRSYRRRYGNKWNPPPRDRSCPGHLGKFRAFSLPRVEANDIQVNSFALSDRVGTLSEMNDGQAFWEMLREIAPATFTGDLPSRKKSDFARLQNLQYINTQVVSYLDEQGAIYTALKETELENLAADGSSSFATKARYADLVRHIARANIVTQFLKLIILVVIIDPPQGHIIERMSALPPVIQSIIASIIQEIDAIQFHPGDDDRGEVDLYQGKLNGNITSSPSLKVDRELVLEEHLAKFKFQLNRQEGEIYELKEEKLEISRAYDLLQQKYDDVSGMLAEHEDELRKLKSQHLESRQMSMRDLEMKISKLEEIIAGQDAQISRQQSHEGELERKIRKLSEADDKLQTLQDNFDEQKVKLEEQTRKANQADNYKRKVQANQGLEMDRDSLRRQLDEARLKLQGIDDVRRENMKLHQENLEIGQTLSRSERDNSELRETKQAYIGEIDRLQRDLKAMREFITQGQARIPDSEEANVSGFHSSPTIMEGGLETELTDTSKREDQMQVAYTVLSWTRVLINDRKSRISNLEKHLRQLADDNSEKGENITTLRQQLHEAQDLSAEQHKAFLENRQEVSRLQTCLEEIRPGHRAEGSVSPSARLFDHAHIIDSTETRNHTTESLVIEQKKCCKLEEKLLEAQKDVDAAISDRMSSFERHCIMTDLTIDLLEGDLLDKPKLQMIEELKKQQSIALMQLQSEHEILQSRHKSLREQYDRLTEERNQAWQESHKAVVAKAEHETKTNAESRAAQELVDIIRQASAKNLVGSPEGQKVNLPPEGDAYAQKIEDNRERVAKARQVQKQLFHLNPFCQMPPPNEQPHSSSSLHTERNSKFSKLFKRRLADKSDDSKSRNKTP